ncbi:Hypothetical protein SMAX5B_000295 [Scophthalmus maximus]|uniref:Uncharacterized protein n=1 Tax=Scophthalmus maximus TaxID=52904 RepID=A0A2U9CJJ6_SCOMX|nr:Hypothetical protein SMAX5B_000295 [Scophthalmus maximus]
MTPQTNLSCLNNFPKLSPTLYRKTYEDQVLLVGVSNKWIQKVDIKLELRSAEELFGESVSTVAAVEQIGGAL